MQPQALRFFAAAVMVIALAPISGKSDTEKKCVAPANTAELIVQTAPLIVQPTEVPADPEKLLYRFTVSDNGDLVIAYHPVWPFEQDPSPGAWSAFMRMVYTGGLKLQRVIYGPGDVEVIEITLDPATGQIKRLRYETAEFDKKGAVIHVEVEKKGDEIPAYSPLAFKVVSWNHLFDVLPTSPEESPRVFKFAPEPFAGELWDHYRMTKKVQGPLSLNRDQYEWEDRGFCPFP